MAQAGRTTVETVVMTDAISLTLTQDEANTLAFILTHIGGAPSTTPRGDADGILAALQEVVPVIPKLRMLKAHNAIYFAGDNDTAIDDGR